ncbi:MAG TPA: lysophospholipid transporter LplT [Burkholderiales bacterium]|nr:lysophospholipid transporter LplT [Burkholderiales bacterium]
MNNGNDAHLDLRLNAMPMLALLLAQFLSALADNAVLVAAIALMKVLGEANHISWAQAGFVLPFIVFAPFVGAFADALPKSRVMLLGNAIKLLGTGLMLSGLNPIASYLCVGIGAAIYSPAKYGILSQFFGSDKLVKANALLEGSTIAAILLGVVLGGILADRSISLALSAIAAIYVFAGIANLFILKIPPVGNQHSRWFKRELLVEFWQASKSLLRDPAARMSLAGTSLFWGSGATLRLILFAWVPLALKIHDNRTPATLMGVLSLGIVLGATLAWLFIKLANVRRAFWGGMLIGPCILALAMQTALTPTVLLMLVLGMGGGVFVVPLNALLQVSGQRSVGTGHALAIQNFAENLVMLLMVSAYGLFAGVPVKSVIIGFGGLLLAGIAMLAWKSARQLKSYDRQ